MNRISRPAARLHARRRACGDRARPSNPSIPSIRSCGPRSSLDLTPGRFANTWSSFSTASSLGARMTHCPCAWRTERISNRCRTSHEPKDDRRADTRGCGLDDTAGEEPVFETGATRFRSRERSRMGTGSGIHQGLFHLLPHQVSVHSRPQQPCVVDRLSGRRSKLFLASSSDDFHEGGPQGQGH